MVGTWLTSASSAILWGILLTINQYNVPNLNIIYEVIIINTNSISCTDSSFNRKIELLSVLEKDRLWQVSTSNLRALNEDN